MLGRFAVYVYYVKKNKIPAILFLSIFLLSFIFGLFAIDLVRQTEVHHDENIHHELEGMVYLSAVNSALWELRLDVSDYLSEPSSNRGLIRSNYSKWVSQIERNMDYFAKLPQVPSEAEAIREFRKNFSEYLESRPKVLLLADQNKLFEAMKYRLEVTKPLAEKTTETLQKLIQFHRNEAQLENTQTKRNMEQIKYIAVGYLVFTIIFYFILTRLLILSVVKVEKSHQSMVHQAKMISLGEMAGGVAHEINNPLAIIMAKASQMEMLLNKGNLSLEQMHKNLSIIMITADRIAKIVRGLKSFARDTGTDPIINVKLSEMIEHVLSLCSEKLRIREIKVEVQVPQEIEIECRQTQMEQMFLSLITNAQDAIENLDVKLIRISAHQSQEQVFISIIDSGKGIPSAIAEKMMLPFFTTKEIGKGMGLGLSIAKGIVEAHQGQFFYDSKSLHTTFVVQMPLRQQQTLMKSA